MDAAPVRYSSLWRNLLSVLHGVASLSAHHALGAGHVFGIAPVRYGQERSTA